MKITSYKQKAVTPAFIFDIDILKKRVRFIKDNLPQNARLCYALKANPFLVKPLEFEADLFEVCSMGELQICQKVNINHKKLVLSGVNKQRDEVFYLVKTFKDAPLYTAESKLHIDLLDMAAKEYNIKINVVLRLSSNNQFGMDLSVIENTINCRDKLNFNILGIHYYSGTQKKFNQIEKEINMLDNLYSNLETKYNFKPQLLEYGPGFSVNYFTTDAPQDDSNLLQTFASLIANMNFKGTINIELGRFICASCGEYITTIADQKTNCGQNYLIVDGGINHLNFYGQTMAMRHPLVEQYPALPNLNVDKWTVCGSLCTVADVIVRSLPLTQPHLNQRLIFKNTGAYTVTEGIYLFLSRDLPNVYFKTAENEIELVRKSQPTSNLNSI